MDLTKVVQAHIAVRDQRNERRKAWEAEDKRLEEVQKKMEAVLLNHLNTHNMDSVRTEAGTFYRQEVVTPSAGDWQAFYDWIKEYDAFDALERRIKRTFITEYMEAHNGGLPPGVSVYREYVTRVRRPN